MHGATIILCKIIIHDPLLLSCIELAQCIFRLGCNREVHRMGRLLVIGTKAVVNKFTSSVDFTGIPCQWAMGYVGMRVKLTNQSHLVGNVKQKNRNYTSTKKPIPVDCSLTLQRGVTSTARHSVNITCRGVTSPARHAARSHSFVYISTS